MKKLLGILLIAFLATGCAEIDELFEGKKGDSNSGASTNQLKAEIYAADWSNITNVNLLETGKTYNIRIDRNLLDGAIVSWDLLFRGANCDIQVFEDEGVKDQAQIVCTTWGQLGLEITALFDNGSEYISTINLGFIDTNPGGNGDQGPVRIYRVLNGTGGGTWGSNGWLQSSGDPARGVVYVGQTLKIINEDSAEHQPFAANGLNCTNAPFPLLTGQSYDCEITQELITAEDYIVDNLNSADGRLSFKAIDADRIYNDQFNCTSCHGHKTGSSAAQIETAIRTGIPAMKFLEAELDLDDGLTASEKADAIRWYLDNSI